MDLYTVLLHFLRKHLLKITAVVTICILVLATAIVSTHSLVPSFFRSDSDNTNSTATCLADQSCTEEPDVDVSLQGAIARHTLGTYIVSDLQYMLLDTSEVSILFKELLGEPNSTQNGELIIDDAIAGYLPAVNAFSNISSGGSWRKVWEFSEGVSLYNEIFITGSLNQSITFVKQWDKYTQDQGMQPLAIKEYPDNIIPDSLGSLEKSYKFIFKSPAQETLECGSQTITAQGRVILVVTYITGASCVPIPTSIPIILIERILPRVKILAPL
jgi:hypothetical protein